MRPWQTGLCVPASVKAKGVLRWAQMPVRRLMCRGERTGGAESLPDNACGCGSLAALNRVLGFVLSLQLS